MKYIVERTFLSRFSTEELLLRLVKSQVKIMQDSKKNA